MFTMKKCMAVMFTFLFLTSSTLALADDEEARGEEALVETSEEVLSVEPAASPEAMAFVQATTLREDDEWHFVAVPYLWIVDTSGTMKNRAHRTRFRAPFRRHSRSADGGLRTSLRSQQEALGGGD